MKKRLYILAALWLCLAQSTYAQFDWEFVASMPQPRSAMASVVLDNLIYVIGGRDTTGGFLSSVIIYNPADNQWENGASLQTGRDNTAAVVKADTIFVMGGRSSPDEIENSVEYFTPANSEWLPFTPLQQSREGLSAVIIENTIYALGGLTKTDAVDVLLNSVEFYNTSRASWQSVDNWQLEEGLALFSAVTIDNLAFVIGGFSSFGPLNLVQRFSADLGANEGVTLNDARGGLAATVRNDSIVVIGGRNGGNAVIGSVEIYSDNQGFWSDSEPLIIRRENHTAATVGSNTYVIGGLDASGKTLASVEAKIFMGAVTSVNSDKSGRPETISLGQNYPNPFNAGSVITFAVRNSNKMTNLSVFNLQGRLVKNLLHAKIAAGEYSVQWNGQDASGHDVASGIFIYTLKQGDSKISKKMLLVR